jgi:succinyl-CoA synthetase beta subunit
MARVKLSEFQAKDILSKNLGLKWQGLLVSPNIKQADITRLFRNKKLVVKVDQGIKKRKKQGLVKVNCTAEEVVQEVTKWAKERYRQFLVEPLIEHHPLSEQYLSVERVREGLKVLYSEKGGVNIEDDWHSVQEYIVSYNTKTDLGYIKNSQSVIHNSLIEKYVRHLIKVFNKYYFSFLEINPCVVEKGKVHILDVAAEIDSEALNLISEKISTLDNTKLTIAEQHVADLDKKTPASLKLNILNENGSIWMLLSGGGASLVLADEVADLGFGAQLGNYGEYSGNPTTDDTYLYCREIIQLMLNSKSKRKVLLIAGGVANFTDIQKTFTGVIKALEEYKKQLKKQGIKVYVRRGGPNEAKGLAQMHQFLTKSGLLGVVSNSKSQLTNVVKLALKNIS